MKKALKLFSLIALLSITTACNKPSSSSENIISDPSTSSVQQPTIGSSSNIQNNTSSEINENVKYLEGTEAAKYLIANTNLDSSLLTGDLFTVGAKALRRVAQMTKRYSQEFGPEGINTNPNSYVNKVGNKYMWVSDEDYGNSLDFFNSTARSIEFSSEMGANLIDYFKTNIRVVDKWIDDGFNQYYLDVTKEYEAIYSFERELNTFSLVKRSIDENGDNVFELYRRGELAEERMKYVPGKRYEFSINFYGEDEMTSFVTADNSKGYWNVMVVDDKAYNNKNGYYDSSTIHNLVLKEEACYEFFYSVYQDNRPSTPEYVELISSDQKRDLLRLTHNGLALYTTGLYNLKHIEVTAEEDNILEEWDYSELPENILLIGSGQNIVPTLNSRPIAVTETTSFKQGDTFVDGKVEVEIIRVGGTGYHPGYGEIELKIDAETIEEKFEILEEFLLETGLELARDIEDCKEGLEFATTDVLQFPTYYKWNDKLINTYTSLASAVKIELDKFEIYKAVYEEIKDIEVISMYDQEAIDANIHFAGIKSTTSGTNSSNQNKVTIQDFTIELEDHLLFVKNKEYKIDFALAKIEDNKFVDLNLLANESTISSTYLGSDDIIFTQSTELTIPHVTNSGDYEIVAFVSTYEEGIRLSSLTRVPVTVSEYEYTQDGYINTFTQKEDYLSISSKLDPTIKVNIAGSYDKSTLENQLISEAYERGLLDDSGKLEVLVDETWTLVDESSYYLEDGQYRVSYKIGEVEDYVICEFTSKTRVLEDVKGVHSASTLRELTNSMVEDLTLTTTYVDKFENNTWTTISSYEENDDLTSGIYRLHYSTLEGEEIDCIIEFESHNIYETLLSIKTFDELINKAKQLVGDKGTLIEDKIEYSYGSGNPYTEVNLEENQHVLSIFYKLDYVDTDNNTYSLFIQVKNDFSVQLRESLAYDQVLEYVQDSIGYTLDSLEETEIYYMDTETNEWVLLEEGSELNIPTTYQIEVYIDEVRFTTYIYRD